MSTEKDREAEKFFPDIQEKNSVIPKGAIIVLTESLMLSIEEITKRCVEYEAIQHARQGERERMCKLIEFAFFEWATNGQVCKARTTEGLLDEFLEQEKSK